MKRGVVIGVSLVLVLMFSISFVSAGWFSDLFGKNVQLSPPTDLDDPTTYWHIDVHVLTAEENVAQGLAPDANSGFIDARPRVRERFAELLGRPMRFEDLFTDKFRADEFGGKKLRMTFWAKWNKVPSWSETGKWIQKPVANISKFQLYILENEVATFVTDYNAKDYFRLWYHEYDITSYGWVTDPHVIIVGGEGGESEIRADIVKVYEHFRGTSPGVGEIDHWESEINSTRQTFDDLAFGLYREICAPNNCVAKSNTEFVNFLYDNLLKRTADAGGLAVHVGSLNGGATQDAVARSFIASSEFWARVGDDNGGTPCIPNCVGKVCGSDGCSGSCGSCGVGQTCNNVGACVERMQIVGYGDLSFVQKLYNEILNRDGTPPELDNLVGQLEVLTRKELLINFWRSDEFQSRIPQEYITVQDKKILLGFYYETLLKRFLNNPSEENYWLGRLDVVGREGVVNEIIESDDFKSTFGENYFSEEVCGTCGWWGCSEEDCLVLGDCKYDTIGFNSCVYVGPMDCNDDGILECNLKTHYCNNGDCLIQEMGGCDIDFVDTDKFKSSLPIIKINTNGDVINSDNKIGAHMEIIDNAGIVNKYSDVSKIYFGEDGDEVWRQWDGLIGIKIRGSSSAGLVKKGYSFETRYNRDSNNHNLPLLGFPAENDWVLHASYVDRTFARNYLAYTLAQDMMPTKYSPRITFVEVFIDGEYQGIYHFIEGIKRDLNRVNLKKDNDNEKSFIIKDEFWKCNYRADEFPGECFWNRGEIPQVSINPFTNLYDVVYLNTDTYMYHWPDSDEITNKRKTNIQNFMKEFEEAMDAPNFINPTTGKHYSAYLDVDNAVDYILMYELFKGGDSFRASFYMYKDKYANSKLILGPVWDMIPSTGLWVVYAREGWQYPTPGGNHYGEPFWINRLFEDPVFTSKYAQRWNAHRQGVLSDVSITAKLQEAVGVVTDISLTCNSAQERDVTRWGWASPRGEIEDYPWWDCSNGYSDTCLTYEQDVAYLNNWLIDRAHWIDEQIDSLVV